MTIEELARRAGTTVRTTRFYIAEGLLPRPRGAGRAADYSEDHLLRLQAILRMRERKLPLSEIRRAVVGVPAEALAPEAGSALAYIDRLLAEGGQGAQPPAERPPVAAPLAGPIPSAPPPDDSPARLPGERWRRIAIHPDVELSVREPVPPGLASRLEAVIERLRRVIEGRE